MKTNKKCKVVLTCWDCGCNKSYQDSMADMYDNYDKAMEAIKHAVEDELNTLNDIDSETPRAKVAIEDSDGNTIGYDYPFRADYTGTDCCIIRFWDGNDYRNVTAYNIHEVNN